VVFCSKKSCAAIFPYLSATERALIDKEQSTFNIHLLKSVEKLLRAKPNIEMPITFTIRSNAPK